MLYHLIVHVSRNINGFWAMCDLSEASVSYVLSTRASAPPRGAYVHYKAPMTGAVNLKPPCARQEISRLREVDILCESNLQY